jgi:hypothetical protein
MSSLYDARFILDPMTLLQLDFGQPLYYRLSTQELWSHPAIVALGRKILTIIYAILKSGQGYDGGHFEKIREHNKCMRLNRMVSELTQAGFSVKRKEK